MRTCAATLAANTLAVGDRIATACLPRHCKSDTQTNHFWLHICIKNGAPAVKFTFTTLPWPMLAVSKVVFYSNDKLRKLRSLVHNACAERCLLGVRKKITKIERKRSYMIHGHSYLHLKHQKNKRHQLIFISILQDVACDWIRSRTESDCMSI